MYPACGISETLMSLWGREGLSRLEIGPGPMRWSLTTTISKPLVSGESATLSEPKAPQENKELQAVRAHSESDYLRIDVAGSRLEKIAVDLLLAYGHKQRVLLALYPNIG
jgi:hypothetical protein